MSTSGKIAIGVSLASGALLAAWLLTGTRKVKTKTLITKGAERIKETLKAEKSVVSEESESHYYI